MPQSYKSEENRPVTLVNNAWDQLSLKTKKSSGGGRAVHTDEDGTNLAISLALP